MANFADLTGQKFNRLTVVRQADYIVQGNGRKRVAWLCECDCGNVCVVSADLLKNGRTASCGCAKAERNKQYFGKHNGSHERLYRVWTDMKKRCYNSNYKQYNDYGGRGIRVCDEWRNDYGAFRDFALSNGYDPNADFGKTTIDRIDVNGDYCPENCRFVDMKVQYHNRRISK